MKKKSLFLPLAAALALTGCTSEELDPNGSEWNEGENRYLAVSIVATGTGSTRAGVQYEDGNLKYEDGETSESEVKGLRIYFFDSNDQPVNVKGTGNYYDVPMDSITEAGTSGPLHNTTVEKKINAVLLVNTGERVPAKLIAVVNPTPDLGTSAYDVNGLRRFVNTYADYANKTGDEQQFVMTNSAYVAGGRPVEYTTIMPENFAKSAKDAKANPVQIYVERCVAKVRLDSNIPNAETNTNDGGIWFPVVDKETGKGVTITKADGSTVAVWVKFLGWDITADLSYGWLLKNVQRDWKSNLIGTSSWNDPTNYRSYWADVCNGGTGKTNGNNYFAYEGESGTTFNHFNLKKFNGTEYKYCNENAEKEYAKGQFYKNTEVIIKAELCDQNGNPLTFTEIAGNRILDDNSFTNLKASYLQMLKSGRVHTHWKVTKNSDGTVESIKEIAADDITFMTANDANKAYNAKATSTTTLENGTYYVYPKLADVKLEGGKTVEWYTKLKEIPGAAEGQPQYEPDPSAKVDENQINEHLYSLGKSKIWNSGKTYYYTTIMQTPKSPDYEGQAGVVRNHIYNITLNKVYGFGTPVYNPTEVIVPEKPTDEDTYIAAKIHMLSWRLIESAVDLEWK